MDFVLDDEQKALRSAVADMATRLGVDTASADVPTGPQPLDRDVWSALAEMGLFGLPFDEAKGGFGASAVEVAIAAAELGKARVAAPYADAMAAAAALDAAGHERLGAVAEGSSIVLTAFGERDRVWSPDAPTRTAEASGDGWTVTGRGLGTVDLGIADAVVTTALVNGELGVFLVESPPTQGFEASFEAASAARLGGQEVLEAALELGVVALAGEALGAMEAALAMTVEYLKSRKQFGVPLMTFQTLTQRAADMYVSVELARSTAYFAAMAAGDRAADGVDVALTSRTKYLAGRAGRHVGQEAIQLHGGIGMTAEYAVGHYTARLTAIEHTFGDSRWHLGRLAERVGSYDQVDVLS